MNTKEAEAYVKAALRERGYKQLFVGGILCLIAVAVLNSFLFTIAISFLKFGLVIAGFGMLIWAGVTAYPDLKKKYENELKK